MQNAGCSLEATQQKHPKLLAASLVLIGMALASVAFAIGHAGSGSTSPVPPPVPSPIPTPQMSMNDARPPNVNFGGWLCLEDWFFSGSIGRHVSTPRPKEGPIRGQGSCLPPGLPGPLDEPWESEGLLVQKLLSENGTQVAIDVFKQHRDVFITARDLDDVRSLGIGLIRLPITWVAFADALAPIHPDFAKYDEDTEVIVPDPVYHDQLSYVTIPRNWLARFLRQVADRDLKVLLDMHAFPGGSSEGTYNGIWPKTPVFWSSKSVIGNSSANIEMRDAGHLIVQKMITWVESLDAHTRRAVGGITVMNEPAHLLKGTVQPDIVLDWVAKAADFFRKSWLPDRGVKLYVNLIETAMDVDKDMAPWWQKTFTPAERNQWAIMDLHRYMAWMGKNGSGTVSNSSAESAYHCHDDIQKVRHVFQNCMENWASEFAQKFPGLRATTEFSLGTNEDSSAACRNPQVLKQMLTEQVTIMRRHNIEPFFWTWRMPYGPNFEPGWSFSSHAGLEEPASRHHKCIAPKSSMENGGAAKTLSDTTHQVVI